MGPPLTKDGQTTFSIEGDVTDIFPANRRISFRTELWELLLENKEAAKNPT
jgi:excinuclease UvrABC helicase subunit UvrB